MEAKHTAGPWIVIESEVPTQDGIEIRTGLGYGAARIAAILRVGSPWPAAQDVDRANARLIAAAPAMYAALVGLFAECAMTHKTWGDGNNRQAAYEAMKAANDAIAKAEGRTAPDDHDAKMLRAELEAIEATYSTEAGATPERHKRAGEIVRLLDARRAAP